MFGDFREYLAYLEKKGLLARIKKEVDVKFEVAAGIKKISDHDGPALLFEKVKGYPSWTVAGGIFGTRKLLAAAFETTEEKLLERTMDLENKKIPPRIVQNGPCKEIILKGDDVDLTQLPIVTHGERDAGLTSSQGCSLPKTSRLVSATFPCTGCCSSTRTISAVGPRKTATSEDSSFRRRT